MALWTEAPELRGLAERVIAKKEDVAHIDPREVLFLWEAETKPKAQGGITLARCYNLKDHPIGLFTDARFAIVFYRQTMDHMNEKQRALLMWHELKHIPVLGDRLINHDVQDFYTVLKTAGLDWGRDEGVPDILE